MRKVLFFLLFWVAVHGVTLKDQLQKGAVGDYVVTQQEKNLSLLRIEKISSNELVLEEVAAPVAALDLPSINWPAWIEKGAPGHTSWLLYKIDLKSGELVESYSLDQKARVSLQEPLLSKMLLLELTVTPDDLRRRIGPSPHAGEEDRRSLWLPHLVYQGKRVSKPTFDVFQTRWPEDGSDLSLCRLEFYFMHNFPFPCWIEASNGHFTFKIHSLASGRNLQSPKSG